MSVRTSIQDETTKIHEYIKKTATTGALSEYLRQQKPKKGSKKRNHHLREWQFLIWVTWAVSQGGIVVGVASWSLAKKKLLAGTHAAPTSCQSIFVIAWVPIGFLLPISGG